MDLHIKDEAALLVNPASIDPDTLVPYGVKFKPISLPAYLYPGKAILLTTVEVVSIPVFFSGLIGMRSTYARLGLLTPPTVADPGFEGTLTLELYNASPNIILLQPGDSIWHILLVSTPFEPKYSGRYQHQSGLTLPKSL